MRNLERVDRAWGARVRFVPLALSPRTLAANWHYARRDARRYARAFLTVAGLPHHPGILRVRAVFLFLISAWIARQVERAGGCSRIHAHFALAQTEVAMSAAALLGVPFGFTAHARDIYATPSALAEKIRAASLVVTCSAYNAGYLRRLCPDVPAGRIQLVHHGVDASHFSPGENRRHPSLILAAGRLIEKKGFDVLIGACALLRDRGVPFRCQLVGDGPKRRQLMDAVRRSSLDGHVDMAGWQPAEQVARTLGAATVFVAPSRIVKHGDRDGIPNVVLEAMAAGCPVVATGVSGIPEAVVDGVTGLLVPPDDPAALADALASLLGDTGRSRALGAAARARALEMFDLSRSSEQLAALFAASPPGVAGDAPQAAVPAATPGRATRGARASATECR
jgi:glycosyltransferase involved in cell wall biosynthesis